MYVRAGGGVGWDFEEAQFQDPFLRPIKSAMKRSTHYSELVKTTTPSEVKTSLE